MSSNPPPEHSPAWCWHQRLLAEDPIAPAEFAALCLEPLIHWVQTTHPTVDPSACAEAAEDAILGVIKNPHSYDPGQLDVTAYLRMAARRDLQNVLRREQRHHQQRQDWNVVELSSADGKYLGREDDPSLPLQIAEIKAAQAPPAVLPGLTATERRVLELMDQGERRTAIFAEVLGILDLPVAEQRRRVKRVKDRLVKRRERSDG